MIFSKIVIGTLILSAVLAIGFNLRNRANKDKIVIAPSSTPLQSQASTPSPTPTPSPTLAPTPKPTPKPTPAKQMRNMEITYYRWAENLTPGNMIAYPHSRYSQTIHEVSSGTGSFSDPLSIATNTAAFPAGARMYAPYIQKYLIVEDICPGCDNNQIDIWLQSDGKYMKEVDDCAGKYTRDLEPIEINPPSDRPVNTAYLFDTSSGICR